MEEKSESFEKEEPIISIIQDLKDGSVDPRMITKEVRQRCVEFLRGEGYTEAQTAQILRRSEKTIGRDLREIRARNALSPDSNLARQIIGDMFKKALVHHSHLMRLARDSGASTAEKSQAEFLAWRVLKEVIEKMQTLGYLPLKPQEVVNDIYHHQEGGDKKTYQDLKQELQDIEKVTREAGTFDPKTEEEIKLLRQRIEKAEIADEMNMLLRDKAQQQSDKETNNE